MGKITTKSAALKSNLITKYLASYLCYNIQYEMCEASTKYIYEDIFTTMPNEIETISRKNNAEKNRSLYKANIDTFVMVECKIDAP